MEGLKLSGPLNWCLTTFMVKYFCLYGQWEFPVLHEVAFAHLPFTMHL